MEEEAKVAGRLGDGLTNNLADSPNTAACRMSARGALIDRARRLHREAAQLEALARSIPENFPHDADEALWTLAVMNAPR